MSLTRLPKFSVIAESTQKQSSLTAFVQHINDEQKFDLAAYWKFREFYSPGSFSFNPEIVDAQQTFRFTALPHYDNDFLYYHSPDMYSVDTITSSSSGDWERGRIAKIKASVQNQNDIVFSDDTTLLYYKSPQTLELYLIRPTPFLYRVNGFFDYTDEEKRLLQYKQWQHYAVINLPKPK